MRTTMALLLGVLWLAGCTTMQGDWNIDADFDWSGKSRYRFGTEKEAEPADPNATHVQRRELTRTVIREELTAKGYREDDSNADFVVQFYVGTAPRGTMYYYRQGQRKGEIDIHMSLSESDNWVWQGWASKTETEALDHDAAIRKAVQQILAKFPPAS